MTNFNNDKQMMVFGYVRVSTDNQLENYSIDEQLQRIAAYCKAKGWILLKTYTDGGYSGGNTNRPALTQMLQAIRMNKVDAVVVYKLDRLSRSQKDTLTLIEDEFLARDVDFVSINENFDTSTPFGRAMIGILSVFAQLEKDQITERFTMGRIGRSKAGYFHGGGVIPFGYTYENGELLINEYQAVIVRELFSLFLSGKSINAIWHASKERYGGIWSAAKVRIILMNTLYIGKVKFAGQEYDGKHQPIVTTEIFEAVGLLLSSAEHEDGKSSAQKTPFRAETLLSSLVYCQRCGARYSGNHGYYKCYSRAKSNSNYITDPHCKNDNWLIEDLNNAVVKSIQRLLSSDTMFKKAMKSAQLNKVVVDTVAISKKLHSIDDQIGRMLDLYQLGTIPMETITARVSSLELERTVLQKQLNLSADNSRDKGEAFAENLRQFAENFDGEPLETRRLLVGSLVEAVHVEGSNIEVRWRI